MAAEVKVNIKGEDQLSPAMKTASEATSSLDKAIQRLAQQDFAQREAQQARLAYDKLTDTEKLMVKATADYADKLRDAERASQKTTQTTKDHENALGKMAGGLNNVVQELTGFNIAQLSVAGGLIAVGNEIKKTITEYSSYVESVDKMSIKTGMAAEDLSRLVQVADDFRVEQSSLTSAMDMALQNGYIPTIDNLAKLADELQGIQDPTEKANKLQEIFGKQWKEITPLLDRGGQAIRDAAAGIGDGLVVTQSAIDANREYMASVDDLADSWTEFKYNITKDVIPALAEMIGAINESTEAQKNGMGRNEFIAQQKALKDGAKAATDWASDQREAMMAAKSGASAVVAYTNHLGDFRAAQQSASQAAAQNSQAILAGAAMQKQALSEIEAATRSAEEAQLSFNESYSSKAAAALKGYAKDTEKYAEGLAIIDEVNQTNLRGQYDAQKALEDLSKKFNDGEIDAKTFKSELERQKSTWAGFDSGLKKAQSDLQGVQTKWENLLASFNAANGTHITITADIDTGGGAPPPTGHEDDPDDELGGYAMGGTVRGGVPVWVNEHVGGEVYVPPDNGRILSVNDAKAALREAASMRGGGGSTLTIGNISLPGITNPQQFIAYLKAYERKRNQSGIGYAGL